MHSKHIETKHKVKEIADKRTFNGLLEASTLSDEDKEIIRMYYLQCRSFAYIADALGYDQKTVELRHKKALVKLSKLL